ncbi:MAG: hypothetical protein AAF636_19230 [Pseudomonadota bacterium]
MKQITPYGRFVRIQRMEKGHLLIDQALYMDRTPSLLSSVELGRKAVPDEWFPIVADFLELDDSDRARLKEAIENTNAQFRVRPRHEERPMAIAASPK